ncbi:MAG TPA: tetratricopeptide repeat protein [Marinobacter sp.]|nr:tetratricopeptide repeat protein [Marinobacter sp.]
MSLLNDALRQAEQRQPPPAARGTYVGQPMVNRDAGRGSLWVLLVLVLSAAGALAWWFWPAPTIPEAGSTPDLPPVASATATPPAEVELVSVVAMAQPMPAQDTVAEPEPESVRAAAANRPEPVTTQQVAVEPARPPASESASESEAEAGAEAEFEPEPEPGQTGAQTVVKIQRETPDAIDARFSRELSDQLARGETSEAERRLADLLETQGAPRSREVLARELLVQGRVADALAWLPVTVTENHTDLRLLRARALLKQGRLASAVQLLQTEIPAVEDNVEYRVTLATLLQQASQPEAAVMHWSELIAFDSARAPWWLGLGLALESAGQVERAVRAYGQAAALPGLSPALADFLEQRLTVLQAGS